MHLRACYPLLLVALAQPALAQGPGHEITPEDYFTLNTITEVAVAPDGSQVAYCLSTWDKTEDNRKTDLWIVASDGTRKPTRLTFDRANDREPKWSADGKYVYFLGNRKREAESKPPFDGKTQVWRIEATGGDPKPMTREPGGISGFDLAPLADALYFSKTVDQSDADAFAKLREKFSKVEYGHGKRKVSEVYRLDLNAWRTEKVIDEKKFVREFAVSRDGKRIAMISAPDDTVIRSEGDSQVEVWDADVKKAVVTDQGWQKTAGSPWPWLESLAWSADGGRLAYCTVFDGYPTEIIACEARAGAWPATRVQRPADYHVRGYGSPLRWTEAGTLTYLAERAGQVVPATYDPAAGRSTLLHGDWAGKVVYALDHGGKQTAVVASDPKGFAELFVLGAGADALTRLVDPNPQTQSWKLPQVRHVTWKAPDGASVGGVLELPHDYKKGVKLPLVVAIHGGPTTATKADLAFDPHNGRLYFTAKGYAVLLPNYRGSTGYGDRFVTDLIGNENDADVKDILAGIQHLIKEGIADSDHVGVMGWSNGGYLTNCLITCKDSPVRFKAASSGGCILDTIAEWGFNDEPAYPRVFKKGLPWEQPDLYRKTSPTYGIGNVTTPTLIHVGGSDERCPPGHSRMLYHALKEYRKVPAELVVYTGEPHGLTKMSNRKAKMEWDLAWFDKYLKAVAAAGGAEPPKGFTALFNGQDLTGWHGMPHFDPYQLAAMPEADRKTQIEKWTDEARQHWTVEKEELVNDGRGAYLTTDKEYGDVELLIEYKTVAKADSGIYLRATPQVQIWDYTKEGGKWNLGADKGSGGLWNNSPGAPGKDPLVLADKPFGEWNALRIIMVGERVTVYLNGKKVVDHARLENFWNRPAVQALEKALKKLEVDKIIPPENAKQAEELTAQIERLRTRPLPRTQVIQLQTHGGGIRWRNVFIREIAPTEANEILRKFPDAKNYAETNDAPRYVDVFNGKDFEGWAGPVDQYEVKDGAIVCKPHKGGTIYTKAEYGDFSARLEFQLPPGGNNGLAIRYPGNGDTAYVGMCELQVLDDSAKQYAKLDPRQYHGSIYGIVASHRGYQRAVGEWNFEEVTIKGSTIKVELNGTVIVDADVSKVTKYMAGSPHPGKDRKSGHFGFAGHSDPVAFRNIQIKVLDKPAAIKDNDKK